MKKEHFEYISTYFNLRQYHEVNAPSVWDMDEEGNVPVSRMMVTKECYQRWVITDSNSDIDIFNDIPTKELALNILKHINETELLFV